MYHKATCKECRILVGYGKDIPKSGVIDLPTIYRKYMIDCITVDGAVDERPTHVEIQFLWAERLFKYRKVCTLITTTESWGSYRNKVELMNGCISKARANLFIPSTLMGSNKNEKGLDECKITENMEVGTNVYNDHVRGAPCLGTKLVMNKGAKESDLVNRRNDLLTFLKRKKRKRTN